MVKKLLLLLFLGAQYVAAQVNPFPIQNASFETYNALNQSFSGGTYNNGPVPGWTATSGSDSSMQLNSTEFSSIPDGTIVLGVSGGANITQSLGISFSANTTYVLQASVGRRADGATDGSTWGISLYAGSTQVCTTSGTINSITSGTFATETLTCVIGSSPTSGNLTVSLSCASGGAGATFDRVILTASIPFYSGVDLGGPIINTVAAPWVWSGPAGSCGTPPVVTSTSGSSFCIGDSNGAPNGSVNGDAWLPLTRTVGKGTATFATTAIAAAACSAVVSPALAAIASTDTIKWSYQTQPTAGTDAALSMQYWPTAGTGLNFKRCNTTASSINPTAIVINWEVTR